MFVFLNLKGKMEKIGLRIKQLRKEKKITLKELADNCNMSKSAISEIENGKYGPNSSTIIKISNYLECTTDWLLKGDEYPEVTHSATSDYSELFSQLNEANKKETLEFIKFKLKLQNPNSGDTNNSSIA